MNYLRSTPNKLKCASGKININYLPLSGRAEETIRAKMEQRKLPQNKQSRVD